MTFVTILSESLLRKKSLGYSRTFRVPACRLFDKVFGKVFFRVPPRFRDECELIGNKFCVKYDMNLILIEFLHDVCFGEISILGLLFSCYLQSRGAVGYIPCFAASI